jgi:beta-aspartyl-peptidase (threonine type)
MSVGALGGDGGMIAMGADGKPAFAINDLGMYRGKVAAGGQPSSAIFPEEKLAE